MALNADKSNEADHNNGTDLTNCLGRVNPTTRSSFSNLLLRVFHQSVTCHIILRELTRRERYISSLSRPERPIAFCRL